MGRKPDAHELVARVAHSLPDASYGELLEYLATSALTRLDNQKGICSEGSVKPATAAHSSI
ncbi:MAG: hypothetical protein H7222_09545 [Methylotenera sp.]|nr:hypothetical protein [Oligoflexia bacterium]